jgi:hypothetical protein
MDFLRLGQALSWLGAIATVALSLTWATFAWGLPGLLMGLVPAVLAARLAAILMSQIWAVIGLAAVIAWHACASAADAPFDPAPQA